MKKHDADHMDAGIDPLDHVPQPGGRLTGATVATVRDQMFEDGTLFRVDDEGLARHFTQRFYSGKAWKVSLSVLRNVVRRLDGCPSDIPRDAKKFPAWLRTEVFEFKHEPREALAKLYEHATTDLAAIAANIADCKKRLADVDQRPPSDGDEIERRFYRHFQRINEEAHGEIVAVLTHTIKSEAVRAAYGPWSPLDVRVPWSFRWNPKAFDSASFSPIRHAFLDLPMTKLRQVQAAYARGDTAEFDRHLADYIRAKQPIRLIREMLDEHHLLALRRGVLQPALEAYERGQLALFASAIAVQIEGIFEDACHLAGVPNHTLLINTIGPKLEALVKDAPVQIDYVYYVYKFPIVRNRVAHGRSLGPDLPRTAALLLLDLFDACRVVRRLPAAPNALVELLRVLANRDPTFGDIVKFATLHVQTEGASPPAFYGLSGVFDALKLVLEEQPFWDFLGALLGAERDSIDTGLRLLAEKLPDVRPALRKDSSMLRRKLGQRGGDPFDSEAFFAAVATQAGHRMAAADRTRARADLLALLRTRTTQLFTVPETYTQ